MYEWIFLGCLEWNWLMTHNNFCQSPKIRQTTLSCYMIHSDKYFLKHTGATLVNELFPFALWIDRHKPCDACMDSVLVNLMGSFHLMANKETINKVNTCFVILSHSISTLLCNPVTRNSHWWVNIFFQSVIIILYCHTIWEDLPITNLHFWPQMA